MKESQGVNVPINELAIGGVCSFDVLDEQGMLLLAGGHSLTTSILDQFVNHGVSSLVVHENDVAGMTGRKPASSGQPEESPAQPDRVQRIDRKCEPYSTERAERFASRVGAAVEAVNRMGEQIESISKSDLSELCNVPNELVSLVIEDSDQTIANANQAGCALSDRCAQLSILAINLGIELNLRDDEVIRLGTAALLHDMGLFLLPEHFRDPTIALTAEEIWDYQRHPSLLVKSFSRYFPVTDEICLIAGQVHERPDGSGYPRGLKANRIHRHASLLSVADAFLTLVSAGPGRPAVLAHDAIGLLLIEGRRGTFDPAFLRAFLNLQSLFPIGSRVGLSNGQQGTVIRRDGDQFATPVVQLDNEVIVLADSEHSISGPVIDKSLGQMRITPSMAASLTLEMLEPGYQ